MLRNTAHDLNFVDKVVGAFTCWELYTFNSIRCTCDVGITVFVAIQIEGLDSNVMARVTRMSPSERSTRLTAPDCIVVRALLCKLSVTEIVEMEGAVGRLWRACFSRLSTWLQVNQSNRSRAPHGRSGCLPKKSFRICTVFLVYIGRRATAIQPCP